MDDVEITVATREDLAAILALQKLAYLKEAKRYGDFTIPPLVQTREEIEAEHPGTMFLAAWSGARIIGSVKGRVDGATCHVGRLMVHPDHQRRGLGTRLVRTLETLVLERHPVERFELFTGEKSHDNIALYRQLGYEIFKVEPYDREKNVVHMKKQV